MILGHDFLINVTTNRKLSFCNTGQTQPKISYQAPAKEIPNLPIDLKLLSNSILSSKFIIHLLASFSVLPLFSLLYNCLSTS